MEFALRYLVSNTKRRMTRNQLCSRILKETGQTNGRVALASATFHLVAPPKIKVHLLGPSEGRQA